MSRFSRRTDFDPTPNAWTRARAAHPARHDLTLSNPTRAALPYDAAAVARWSLPRRLLHNLAATISPVL